MKNFPKKLKIWFGLILMMKITMKTENLIKKVDKFKRKIKRFSRLNIKNLKVMNKNQKNNTTKTRKTSTQKKDDMKNNREPLTPL